MKNMLKTIAAAYGPTGSEENICGVIRKMVEPLVDEISVDALGNLICVKKGAGKKIMLAAHMDQIGFIVTNIDENGFLRVCNVGGIRKANSLNRHVVFENGVSGVLAHEAEKFNAADNDMNSLFIDIGAADREDALKRVQVGDMAVYSPDIFDLGDDMVAGPAMDDRCGCAVVVRVLQALKDQNCPNEVVAVFTTQEEVGLRGATVAAYAVTPDIGVALDVTQCGDTPKGFKIAVKAGKGPCVKIFDRSHVGSPKVVKLLEKSAEAAGVPYQREVLTAGGTDASAIQMTKGGIPATTLSIACRYVHSACEAVSVSDCKNGAKLLTAMCMDENI